MYRETSIIALLLAALLLLLQGCATLDRLSAVPVKDTTRATIPGIPNARFWVDADLNPLIREDLKEFEREEVEWTREGQRGPLPPAHYLAIAGGGDDGALPPTSMPGVRWSGTWAPSPKPPATAPRPWNSSAASCWPRPPFRANFRLWRPFGLAWQYRWGRGL